MLKKPYHFLFTHKEEILDELIGKLHSHPKVSELHQGTGNWYSNGETGPEWFSMDISCEEEDVAEIQAYIMDELKKMGTYSEGSKFIRTHT